MSSMRWNIGFITVQAGLVVWAHAVGVSWLTLGLLFAGLALAAWAAFAYLVRVHVPRGQRRYQRQLRMSWAEHALAEHARAVERLARPALPAPPPPCEWASSTPGGEAA
jgi:hypothetical protein